MKGGVRFEIQASLVERVIEHATLAGIKLISAERTGADRLTVWVSGSGEKRLAALMDSFHLRYSITGARGLTRVLRALKRECALLIMLCICALFLSWLAGRVWILDVQCADGGAQIARVLEELGARAGAAKADIDAHALEDALLARLPGYAHVGVKLSGVVLRVEAVGEARAPEVFELRAARDLVADADAVIVSIDVKAGAALVKPGDTVRKGQVLILGEERVSADGETKRVRAEGTVTARTWARGQAACALTKPALMRTGRESAANALTLKWFTRPLNGENPFELYETEVTRHKIGGLFCPVHITRTRYIECEWIEMQVDADAARDTARAAALAEARKRVQPDAREIKIWAEYQTQGDRRVAATVVIETLREIAADADYGGR